MSKRKNGVVIYWNEDDWRRSLGENDDESVDLDMLSLW